MLVQTAARRGVGFFGVRRGRRFDKRIRRAAEGTIVRCIARSRARATAMPGDPESMWRGSVLPLRSTSRIGRRGEVSEPRRYRASGVALRRRTSRRHARARRVRVPTLRCWRGARARRGAPRDLPPPPQGSRVFDHLRVGRLVALRTTSVANMSSPMRAHGSEQIVVAQCSLVPLVERIVALASSTARARRASRVRVQHAHLRGGGRAR